jgi:hypothetical protein
MRDAKKDMGVAFVRRFTGLGSMQMLSGIDDIAQRSVVSLVQIPIVGRKNRCAQALQ